VGQVQVGVIGQVLDWDRWMAAVDLIPRSGERCLQALVGMLLHLIVELPAVEQVSLVVN
jgi:hypothetical protein